MRAARWSGGVIFTSNNKTMQSRIFFKTDKNFS